MGKTIKGKDKIKAKADKAKRKIARKAKGCACILAAFALAAMAGCTTSDSAQPAKAQVQNNEFNKCIFVMTGDAVVSNDVVTAKGGGMEAPEMFTQTQSLETTGSTDSFGMTATQTPTTDVKPDVDVSVPVNKAGTAQSVGSALGDAAVSMIKGLTSSDGNTTGTAATCTNCTDGTCADCTVK